MARTGPPPPEPNWDRIDLRGLNSTRHAWGYLSPDDKAIVSDRGRVYILVDEGMLEKLSNKRSYGLKIMGKMAAILQRCLRWSRIVQEMFEFEEDIEESEDFVQLPTNNFEPRADKKGKLRLRRNRETE